MVCVKDQGTEASPWSQPEQQQAVGRVEWSPCQSTMVNVRDWRTDRSLAFRSVRVTSSV